MNDTNDTVSTSLWRRRTVLGALGAAPVAVGAALAGTGTTLGTALTAAEPSGHDRIPAGHSARRSLRPVRGGAGRTGPVLRRGAAVAPGPDGAVAQLRHGRQGKRDPQPRGRRGQPLLGDPAVPGGGRLAGGAAGQGDAVGHGGHPPDGLRQRDRRAGDHPPPAHQHLRAGRPDAGLATRLRQPGGGARVPPAVDPAGGAGGRPRLGLYASGDGFATAPDLVRFAEALRDGTVLDRPFAELFAGAKLPGPEPTSFEAYTMPVSIINGQWVIGRSSRRRHHRPREDHRVSSPP